MIQLEFAFEPMPQTLTNDTSAEHISAAVHSLTGLMMPEPRTLDLLRGEDVVAVNQPRSMTNE